MYVILLLASEETIQELTYLMYVNESEIGTFLLSMICCFCNPTRSDEIFPGLVSSVTLIS